MHVYNTHTLSNSTPDNPNSEQQNLVLPLDLVVRFGICQLHLGKLPSALQCFASLRQRVR